MTTSPGNEDREDTRLDIEATIFIELQPSDVDSPGSVIMCSSWDLSAHGLQVVVDDEIDIGTILRLCIDFPTRDPIFLVAEVKWVQEDPDCDGIRLGFLIFDSEDTDVAAWRLLIEDLRAT